MTRSDLANKLSIRMKIRKEEADRYLLAFIDAITKGLEKDNKVVVQGFGSFKIKEYKSRMGQKPITGEPILIPTRTKAVFHPGKELREIVNHETESEAFVHYDLTQARVMAQI